MELLTIAKERYATKLFDGKSIPEDKIEKLLELIRLSASSFGLQPYKIIVVTNKKLKEELEKASWGQKQITSCSHLLVFVADTRIIPRINGYEAMLIDSGLEENKARSYTDLMREFEKNTDEEQKKTWAQKQCYIALGNALNGSKSLGFDSCPMEGFDKDEYKRILNLEENEYPTVICPVGYAADKPRPKIRFSKEDIFINMAG